MHFLVFYFTGTGNTLWAVRQFSRFLEEKGCRAQLVAVEAAPQQDAALAALVSGADWVCFAYPVYGADMPTVMRAFLGRLARLAGSWPIRKPACCVATYGYVNGFGPIEAGRLLSKAGFDMMGHVNVRLLNSVSTPPAAMKRISPAAMEKRKHKADARLKAAINRLLSGKKSIGGRGPYLVAGKYIRRFFGPMIVQNYKTLAVDMALCTRCLACVEQCPTNSITFSDEGFTFQPSCTACSRCYNNCPTAAVMINGIYADPEVYFRHRGIS